MPVKEGVWDYIIRIGNKEITGSFECTENAEGIHGPVRTKGERFVYDDGSRFLPFGTTCYAWLHQTEELRAETLHTLENAPFNKIRMCIFPKSMPYNNNAPEVYPFRKKEDGRWDVNDPDLKFWDMLDEQIIRLKRIGIEADLILFHPFVSKRQLRESVPVIVLKRLAGIAKLRSSAPNHILADGSVSPTNVLKPLSSFSFSAYDTADAHPEPNLRHTVSGSLLS